MSEEHKYQGGQVVPSSTPMHYHVDYLIGDDLEMGWGFVIDVVSNECFKVINDWKEPPEITEFKRLTDALKFCFSLYQEEHPNTKIEPLWGAGSANEALVEIGFIPPKLK